LIDSFIGKQGAVKGAPFVKFQMMLDSDKKTTIAADVNLKITHISKRSLKLLLVMSPYIF